MSCVGEAGVKGREDGETRIEIHPVHRQSLDERPHDYLWNAGSLWPVPAIPNMWFNAVADALTPRSVTSFAFAKAAPLLGAG